MKIRIIGGGSLGLLLAGRLAGGTERVEICCRSARQADMINEQGIQVSVEGEVLAPATVAALSAESAAFIDKSGDKPDWLLVTVKQKDIDPAFAKQLADQCGTRTRLACFQNGIGHMELLAKEVGRERLYAAITTEGARREGLAEVEHTGRGVTWLGPVYPAALRHVPDAPVAALLAMFSNSGLEAGFSPRMEQLVWNKLIINAIINPLTAVMKIPNGALLASSELVALMRLLYEEAASIAGCQGIIVSENLWEQVVGVCERTAKNHSSMLQDVMAGRETEIEAITGSMIKLGEECGYEARAHRMLYGMVKALVHKD